jgi:hypothetical protein
MNWAASTAKVFYDPVRPGIRKVRPGSLVVANVDPGIAEYYRWWVKKQHGLQLQNTAWYPHITVVDGKVNSGRGSEWKKYQSAVIDFEYSAELEQHWKFWVLPVRSRQLEMIRHGLGLNPDYNFHITVGRMF